MFNASTYKFNMQNNVNDVKIIIEVADKGIQLLGKNIDYATLRAWQKYVDSVLKLITSSRNNDYYSAYMQFNVTILMCSPYEKVKRTVEFLLALAKQL